MKWGNLGFWEMMMNRFDNLCGGSFAIRVGWLITASNKVMFYPQIAVAHSAHFRFKCAHEVTKALMISVSILIWRALQIKQIISKTLHLINGSGGKSLGLSDLHDDDIDIIFATLSTTVLSSANTRLIKKWKVSMPPSCLSPTIPRINSSSFSENDFRNWSAQKIFKWLKVSRCLSIF